MYNPPVRSDRPSSDGTTGTGGVGATVDSNSTRVSSEAEKSSLNILKCLWAELRTSAVKEASRRITGCGGSNSSPGGSFFASVAIVFLLKILRDPLRMGRGIDGNGLYVVVVGRVLDLESGGFGPRSDGWDPLSAINNGGRGQMDTFANSTT